MKNFIIRFTLSVMVGVGVSLTIIGSLAAMTYFLNTQSQTGTSLRASLIQDMYVILHTPNPGTILNAASAQQFKLSVNGKVVESRRQDPRPVGVSTTDYPEYYVTQSIPVSDGDRITLASNVFAVVQFDNSAGVSIQPGYFETYPEFLVSRFSADNPARGGLFAISFFITLVCSLFIMRPMINY